MLGDDSTLASKSTDCFVNRYCCALARPPVFSPSLSLRFSRFSPLARVSSSFLPSLCPSLSIRYSSTLFLYPSSIIVLLSHGWCSTEPREISEERSDPGDRRAVTVIPQKDSDARLLSSYTRSFYPSPFPSLCASLSPLSPSPLSILLPLATFPFASCDEPSACVREPSPRWTGRFSRTN